MNSNIRHVSLRPTVTVVLVAVLASVIAACASGSKVPVGKLTPVKDRATDEAIAHDFAVFDSLDRRVSVVMPRDGSNDRYLAARAQEYVRLARDAYERNDRTSFVEDALAWAVADIESLERRAERQGVVSVVPMPHLSGDARAQLWSRVESLRSTAASLVDPEDVAKGEVQLIRAGHAFLAGPACVDEPALAAAQRLLGEAEKGGRTPPPALPRDTTPSIPMRRDTVVVPPPPPPPPPANEAVPDKLAGVPTIVHFALDKSYLSPTTKEVLDHLIEKVKPYGGVHIVLSGHTDIRASDVYNQALSERRVKSVRDYLVSKGLEPSRLTSQGFGERKLMVDGQQRMDHARNRRVAISYVLKDGTEILPVEQLSDIQLEAARRAAAAKKKP